MHRIIKFIDKFDVKNLRNRSLGRFIFIVGLVIFIAVAAVYGYTALKRSSAKAFWTDEKFGLNDTVRTNSVAQLLVSGAPGQGSPAPLDYIFLRILDNVRIPFHLEWVPFNVYYRLNSIFWTFGAGAVTTFVYFFYFRSNTGNYLIFLFQMILLSQALAHFYFRHEILHYAMETRPYALWNALWYGFMAFFLFYRDFNRALLLISTALALTSSGALFQLSAFVLCRFVFLFLTTREFIPALKKTMIEFSLPLLISIYYTSRCPHFGYSTSVDSYQTYLKEFWAFWADKSRTIIFAVFGIIMTLFDQKWRPCSIVFLTIILLYILSPLCNLAILSKGLFFTPRQYLYYDQTLSIFLLGLSLMLPDYWKMLKGHYLPH